MKKFLLIIVSLFVAFNISAQVMPGKDPSLRLATDQESRILKSADVWHDVALSATAFTGCAAAVCFIFVVEDRESIIRDHENSDKKVYRYAGAIAAASAVVSAISWTMSIQKKRSLPSNIYVVKTSPKGLVIEF